MIPNNTVGLGLRPPHYQSIIDQKPSVDFFEIITDNFLTEGGRAYDYLELIRRDYPITMHGVSLSLGGQTPLNQEYLFRVKQLAERIEATWISEHLCWTGVHGIHLHDLLPLPYTEESLNHVVNRIIQSQEFLGQQLLIENVSSYVEFKDSTMTEWEFLTEVAHRADCFILLDVNNIFVSAFNHKTDPETYLHYIPLDRVKECHLAGHSQHKNYIVDTHDQPIIPEVWSLYRKALERFGPIPTLIERDDNIPPLAELIQEVTYAKQMSDGVSCD